MSEINDAGTLTLRQQGETITVQARAFAGQPEAWSYLTAEPRLGSWSVLVQTGYCHHARWSGPRMAACLRRYGFRTDSVRAAMQAARRAARRAAR